MKHALVYLLGLLVCAGLAWLSGFNFNERGIGVALYTLVALAVSAIPVLVMYEE